MALENLYREVMELNQIRDMDKRETTAKSFFKKLNHLPLPDTFNWATEIFEGIHVKERGDQLALIWTDLDTDAERQFTYKELSTNGNKLLNFIRNKGAKKGDNLYIMTPIVPETWFASLAAIKGGIVAVPTATSMTAREIQFRFETYKPNVIIAMEALTDLIDDALKTTGCTPKAKIVLGKKEGWTSYSELDNESAQTDPANLNSRDVLFCFFTSGTTGLPKLVGHNAMAYPLGHLSTSVMIGIEPGDVHNNLGAPGWAKWAWSSFFAPFNLGATASGFAFTLLDIKKYIAAIAKYKINSFCAPPTAWRTIVGLDLEKYDLTSMKYSLSAGEPLNPEVIEQWEKITGTEIRDFYGQTESCAMIGNPPWMEGKMRFGSFGYPAYMYDIILADDDGNEITTAGEPGHIVVRLKNSKTLGLFQEYLYNSKKTEEAFQNDMYFTGDKAFFDQDGYWWFVGRSDDVIKSSDFRVGPFEVESALIEHPAVMETAVVGSPDTKRYQLVKAFVVLNEDYEASKELASELFQHTIDVLAKFKIPRIIEFVDELPKTISGKIKRIELRKNEVEKKKKKEAALPNEYFYHQFPELGDSHKNKLASPGKIQF